MILLQLYWSFFKIGCFSIGGGYAALPLIQQEAVIDKGYLTLLEFTDIITISQMTPGPIAINAATFVGTNMAGLWGSIFATLGFVTPSFIIVILFSYFFFKYSNLRFIANVLSFLSPTVIGIIVSVAISLFVSSIFPSLTLLSIDLKAALIFIVCMFMLVKLKMKILSVIPVSAVMGIVLYMI